MGEGVGAEGAAMAEVKRGPAAGESLGVLRVPAAIAGRVLGVRAIGRHAAIALTFAVLVAGWAVWTSWGDAGRFGGTDLRARVVGARQMLAGLSPYFSRQDIATTPERLFDPDRYYTTLSRCTYTPTVLALYAALADVDYAAQRRVWMVLEWGALLVSVVVLARAIPGGRGRVFFGAMSLVFFAGDWSMRLHAERGQYYTFVLLLMSLATWAAVRLRKGALARADSVMAGLLLGAAAALRPTVIAAAGPLVLLRRWRVAAGMVAGGALAVAATLPLAGPSAWREFFKVAGDYETVAYHGQGALDPPALNQARPVPPPGQRLIVEGADFTEKLEQRDVETTFAAAWVLWPAVRAVVPEHAAQRVAKGMAVLACGAAGVVCLGAWRRRVPVTIALAAGFAMITVVETFWLATRFAYADVMCLPTLAMLSPLMVRRAGRPWGIALVVLMLPGLVMPRVETEVVRTLGLLAVQVGLVVVVLSRRRGRGARERAAAAITG